MLNAQKVTECPSCDAVDFEQIGRLAEPCVSEAASELFTQPSYFLRRCVSCGLYYKSHVIDGHGLARYYSQCDYRKWEIAGLFPTERVVLRILRRLPKGARILDYGCSSGRLLHRIVERYECLGYEVNPAAREAASRKGIKMLAALSELKEYSLHAVVMVDVFEHLPRPTEVIRRLARLVKPGGIFVIVTGNADAPIFSEYLETFWYLRTIEHVVMLSRSHAEYLSSSLNMDLEDWIEVSHYAWKLRNQLSQRIRRFAYRSFQKASGRRRPLLFLRALPMFSRAEKWKYPPPFDCSRDHVVAVFRIL
jgi:2-polyprenyl-3-methyl-5-hydroxy-6-metoxy-1,4-benzoquinol methylase